MLVKDFDYDLPEELIAQDPIEPRDASRLLILNKASGAIRHSIFSQIGAELNAGDMLIINDTRVLPARIYATTADGSKVEVLLLKQLSVNSWQALTRPGRRTRIGCRLSFDLPDIAAKVIDYGDEGSRIIEFAFNGDFLQLLERLGEMPLPPYIKKKLHNQERYQPVYAREQGSAAAPTAGLHFTEPLLAQLRQQGILIEKILLHVGLGTFRPVKTHVVEEHFMHSEYYRISAATADRINAARRDGGRIIAVGTTSVRTLETVASADGLLSAAEGWTEKYIYPGYRFKIVDAMITNFHLPKSTLIMLVSALAGRENTLNAYQEAINCRYRFYSFGDAMLII